MKKVYALWLLLFLNHRALTENNIVNNHSIKSTEQELSQEITVNEQEAQTESPAPTEQAEIYHQSHHPEKEWNFIVYMAANNNLHKYALKNFRQMLQVGSNDQCNILVQLDEFGEDEANRFYIQKNKAVIKAVLEGKEAVSGTPESLFNFVEWAIKTYKARRQTLVLWNHGSGIKDPSIWGKFYKEHRDDLYTRDETTGLLQLNRRNLRALAHAIVWQKENNFFLAKAYKGIGFNETHEQYLDNQQLRLCLERIQKELLNGNKLDVVILDACHMSMIEIASKFKYFTNYLVGSEEIEPGSGYNYKKVLSIFSQEQPVKPAELAEHAVLAYDDEYKELLADYTQSAITLTNFESCEIALSNFASYLKELISEEHDYCKFIKKIRRDDELTTEFCDWDYVDAIHFFTSVSTKARSVALENSKKNKNMSGIKLEQLALLSENVAKEVKKMILANASGINLPQAYGLSIYFPEKSIHKSYPKTTFAKNTSWLDFLTIYLKKKPA